jgi:hypothetical protein
MGTLKVGRKVNTCYTRGQLRTSSEMLPFPYVFDATNIKTLPMGTELPKYPAAGLSQGMTVAIDVNIATYTLGNGGITFNLNTVALLDKDTPQVGRKRGRTAEEEEEKIVQPVTMVV